MNQSRRHGLAAGLLAGTAATILVASMMGQSPSQPVRSAIQYFVTAEGDQAHLWVREGAKLRCVGHGECAEHAGHSRRQGDGHDH